MRQRLRIAALTLFAAAMLIAPANSWALGSVRWAAVGPFGSAPWQIKAGPEAGVLWGLGAHAVYRSADGGSSWQPVLQLRLATAESVLPDASAAGCAYVQVWTENGERVLRTIDSGATWQRGALLDFSGSGGGTGIVVDPVVAHRLWALEIMPAGAQPVYRSDDGGATWQAEAGPVDGARGLAAAAGSLWVWTDAGAILKSGDGGATFSGPVNAQLFPGRIEWVRPDPSGSGVAYASVRSVGRFWSGSGGPTAVLYRTADGGATWTRDDADVAAGFEIGDVVFGGGRTVARVQRPWRLADLYADGRGLMLRTAGGWAPLNDGYPATDAPDGLTADAAGRFCAAVWSGRAVYDLSPGSTVWSRDGVAAHEPIVVGALTVAPWNGQLLASTPFGLLAPTGDAGWAAVGTGFPADPLIRRVATAGGLRLFALVSGSGIYASSDGGATWQTTPSQPPSATGTVDIAASPRVLLATDGIDVWRSLDRGGSWTPVLVLNHRPSQIDAASGVNLAGLLHRTAVAYGADGVWLSRNGGESWSRQGWMSESSAVFAGPDAATGPDGRVYVPVGAIDSTIDGGRSWQQTVLPGSAGPVFTQAVTADPRRAGVAWATDGYSLWRTADGGERWRRVGQLPVSPYQPASVTSMVVASNGRLEVATFDRGILEGTPGMFERSRPLASIRRLQLPRTSGARIVVSGRAIDRRGGSGLDTVEYSLVVHRFGRCFTWSLPDWFDGTIILEPGGFHYFRAPCDLAARRWTPVTTVRRLRGIWSLTLPETIPGRWTLRIRAIDRETNAQLHPAVRTFRVR